MPTSIPTSRDDFDIWTSVSIRYSDQDPMQHVNNVALTAYLESGRANLINELIGTHGRPESGMVLAGLTVDYLHEITYPGTVEVGGRLAGVGNRSFTTQYAVFQRERCCVISQSTNVFFDTVNRCSMEPPELVRQKLLAALSV